MKSWIFDIKRSIHNNRWIREGYACYSCFLPMMFCAEPGEPCQKWKFSTNDVECEWKNIVIEFNVLIYNLHVTGRHDMHYETAIGSNHQLAKVLVKNGIIHNTECIQGVIWLWEFDWFEWVQKASGVITSRVSNAIEFESADQEEAIEISSEAGSEAGDEAGDKGGIEAGDEAGIEAGSEESSESEVIEDEISEKSVREEFPPDSDDSIISQFR
jgi:hypothetical protein